MKSIVSSACLLAILLFHGNAVAQNSSPEEAFLSRVKSAKVEYRLAKGAELAKATHIVVSLLDFTDMVDSWDYSESDPRIQLPSEQFAKAVSSRELAVREAEPIVRAITSDVAKKEAKIGAMLHLPTHSIELIVKSPESTQVKILFSCSVSIFSDNLVHAFPDDIGCEALTISDSMKRELKRLIPYPNSLQEKYEKWKSGPGGF